MKRGGVQIESDSLELLLDTICNVFGGIVLMAILVVIQTQSGASMIARLTQARGEETLRLRELLLQRRALEADLADVRNQERNLAETFVQAVTPSMAQAINRREEFVAAHQEASKRLPGLQKEAAQVKEVLPGLTKESKDLAADAVKMTEELEAIKKRLHLAAAELPKNVRLPHQRGVATGTAVYFVLVGNEAYRLGLPDWYRTAEFRSGDCMVKNFSDAVTIRKAQVQPIPGAGRKIVDGEGKTSEFARFTATLDASGSYVVFFVRGDDDAAAGFQEAKRAVLDRRLRYAFFVYDPKDGLTVYPGRGHLTE
jgi:hypothetical protein